MKGLLYFFLFFIASCGKGSETINSVSNEENKETENVEIFLINNLNDTRGFCIDIKGSKQNANVNSGLQSHTCYSYQGQISVDQGFDKLKIDEKQFYITFFKVCMEAQNIQESASLLLNQCNQSEKQKFILKSNGNIVVESNPNLCLTVATNYKEGGGGNPVHLIRELTLQNCGENNSDYQKWGTR